MKKNILVLILIYLFFLLPIVILIFYAFSSYWEFPRIIPRQFNWQTFKDIYFQSDKLIYSILSSLFYSFSTVILTLVLTFLPASVFARYQFKLKHLLESILLAPALVPSMTYGMGLHYVFLKIGLADNYLGIILILSITSYPYMLRALTAGFIAYHANYSLCAKNLGATAFTIIRRIEFPLLLPSIIAGGSIVFLVAFSNYFLVYLIGGGAILSFSGYLFPFLNSSDRHLASLLTLIFLILPILIFFLIDKVLINYYRKRAII